MAPDGTRHALGGRLLAIFHLPSRLGEIAVVFAAFALVLAVHAALPGVAMPTLGQAIWTTSFAQSFADAGFLAIHAEGIGYPGAAAISLGLAGAVPCAWLIKLGLAPPDAYSGMVALWLGVSFLGAMALCRHYDTTRSMAACLAALWLCLPMVWAHVDYSMVSLGMALLPAYTWSTLRSLDVVDIRGAVLVITFAMVAAFMDGYTFMMFALATGLLDLGALLVRRVQVTRRHLFLHVLPLHIAAFAMAYGVYRAYVHGGDYTPAPTDMFRAWGMDVVFAVLPTSGEFWLWDLLHATSTRSGRNFYGDASVWATTFGAPLLLIAVYAAWRSRRVAMKGPLIALALLAFFLSLGPSLKVDSQKPPGSLDVLMPADAAIGPTGSALLSEHVPGFRLMRATYRWAALGYLACWMLLVICVGERRLGRTWVTYVVLGLIILGCLPHPLVNLRDGMVYRRMATSIENDWVGALRKARVGPIVAFAPHGNDFLAAYAAARLGIRTFNIGGDKNLEQAMQYWPDEMADLGDPANPSSAASIEAFLRKRIGSQVVIPYVDLVRSAHFWPCTPGNDLDASSTHRSGPPSSACVNVFRKRYATTIESLRLSAFVTVDDGPLFAVVRPSTVTAAPNYPIIASREGGVVLTDGWFGREANFQWSGPLATLALPIPPQCASGSCTADLSFDVFAASDSHLVDVNVRSLDGMAWQTSLVADGKPGLRTLSLPLTEKRGTQRFRIEVPGASSPFEVGGASDRRKLGIALIRIDLRVGHGKSP